MKKILIVIDSLSSGGAEKSLTSMLNLLDYSKFQVDLLLFKKGGLYLSLVPPSVQIISPTYNSRFVLRLRLFFYSIIFRLINVKNRFVKPKKYHGAQTNWRYYGKKAYLSLSREYDVAIAYSQGQPTYFVANKVKAKKKICWINTDYNIAGYNPLLDQPYYDCFSKIVLVSDSCKTEFLKLFPKYTTKTTVVYDIISSKLIQEMSNEGISYQDNFKGIRILTIGRLVYAKGYEYALEAASILKDKGIIFRWYAIGEGNLLDILKQTVRDKGLEDYFYFLGTYVNPYPFIKDCNIYCQPSRFEGFGMAIAEAKILKKPVVATNFPIIYNQITPGKNGLVCEMNGKILAETLIELINNKDLHRNIIRELKKEILGTDQEICKIDTLIEG